MPKAVVLGDQPLDCRKLMNKTLQRRVRNLCASWDVHPHAAFYPEGTPMEQARLSHLLHEVGHAHYEGIVPGQYLEARVMGVVRPKPRMQQDVSEDYAILFAQAAFDVLSWDWLEQMESLEDSRVRHLDPTRNWEGPEYFRGAATSFCNTHLASC